MSSHTTHTDSGFTPLDDTLVCIGGEVKALDERDGELKVGGYIVLFGTPADADLSAHRDYFTKSTDFGLDVAERGRVRWQHGLDPHIGRRVLGLAGIKADPADEVGIWAEGWIKQRDAYEKKVGEWVKARKAGWSTGVAPHCVGRKASDNGSHEITEWPLGADLSITLTPADPRQAAGVIALKSLIPHQGHEPPEGAAAAPAPTFLDALQADADSGLLAAVSRFPKVGDAKLAAIKSYLDSWQAQYHRLKGTTPAAMEAEFAAMAESVAQFDHLFGSTEAGK